MPAGILSLPDEVLDLLLKTLLPPFRSQSLAETYVITVPVDLLVARLVSRRLHRIATPLAWRRTQLRIASPAAMSHGNYGLRYTDPTFIAAAKTSICSLVRCRFFHEHPELAEHVRILLVTLVWDTENPDLARDALQAATNAMSNLRTVLVWDDSLLRYYDIRQILQKLCLRAICLMDVDGTPFVAQCDLGPSLKMLHIANSKCPAAFVAKTSLECVSIELADNRSFEPVLSLREMPWKTLREVALVDCDNLNEVEWLCFLDGFRQHKRLGLHTVLTELMIGDLAGLDSLRVNQILDTFAGQPLTRLTLYHLLKLDPPTLCRIVKAFTVLRHLTLLTDGELAPWPGALDAYAQAIAGLSLLETLTWNNFILNPALDATFLFLNNDILGTLYAKDVHALVRHVGHIRYIKFMSATDCIVDTVYIKGANAENRNRSRNRNTGPFETRRVNEAALHTSSWSTAADYFQDI